jgi:hypothetical protein
VNKRITFSKGWKDITIKIPRWSYLAGLPCGLVSLSGSAINFALVNIRNEQGLVPNEKFMFL